MRLLLASTLCHFYFVIQTEAAFSARTTTAATSSQLYAERSARSTNRASATRQLQQEKSTTCPVYENGFPQRHITDHIRTTYSKKNTSRRKWLRESCSKLAFVVTAVASTSLASIEAANAATRPSLSSLLYSILRVREATGQETRLIRSGKFKDVQRANVKLAIKFMLENYRLSDSFVSAASYLDDYQLKLQAGQVGQAAVQNLYTILEYFDSSDVQNLKVDSAGGLMGGKEELVLKGLDAAQKSMDDFLAYFPKSDVDPVRALIKSENELNVREFDPALGTIVNLPPPS